MFVKIDRMRDERFQKAKTLVPEGHNFDEAGVAVTRIGKQKHST